MTIKSLFARGTIDNVVVSTARRQEATRYIHAKLFALVELSGNCDIERERLLTYFTAKSESILLLSGITVAYGRTKLALGTEAQASGGGDGGRLGFREMRVQSQIGRSLVRFPME